jgi:hypothetical protein
MQFTYALFTLIKVDICVWSDLHTSARFKTRKVTVLLITQDVIDAVNKLGKQYGQVGLKFNNRFGVIMQDADQITGVDDEYQFQEDHQDNSDDEEDNDNDSSISDSSSDTGSSDSDDDNDDDDDNGEDDEQVDTAELHDVLEDNTNLIQHQDEEDDEVEQDEEESTLDNQNNDEEDDGLPRQSTRIRKEPERLNITSTTGKSYDGQQSHLQGVETTNKVYFADQQQENLERLEYMHNLVAQVRP